MFLVVSLLSEVIFVVSYVDEMFMDVLVVITAFVETCGPVTLGEVGQLSSSSPFKQSCRPSQSDLFYEFEHISSVHVLLKHTFSKVR